MPDQNSYFSRKKNPVERKKTRKISSVPTSLGIRLTLNTFSKQLFHIFRISISIYWHNILHPVSHRVPHTHRQKRGMNPWGIYGGVRFVDLGMLLLRPISLSSTCPFIPLWPCTPNFLLSCWPRFNRTNVDSRGGGNAHCGIPTFHSMAYEKNLKKRHTLNFLASILTKDLTRGWHLAGIKHASLI